jgi:exopolysaccharide biosynthesis WecB/TagA/CpsF family protein
MIERGKHNVLGVRISAVDYDATVTRIIDAAQDRRPLAVSALAVHGVITGVLDASHRYRLNRLDLLVPDGQPVRWALRWLHRQCLPDRVYGPNLMLRVCERAAAEGLSIFLYGSTAPILSALRRRLLRRIPGLQIAGARPSQFRRQTPAERDATWAAIRASGAAVTFVGLGCPRQEVWAYEAREALSMPVVAVGAAFNFHAGLLPQAPPWLQSRGLEWLFRLAQEPRRLWRRYLFLNPLYLGLVALQFARVRAFDPDDAPRPVEEMRYG